LDFGEALNKTTRVATGSARRISSEIHDAQKLANENSWRHGNFDSDVMRRRA